MEKTRQVIKWSLLSALLVFLFWYVYSIFGDVPVIKNYNSGESEIILPFGVSRWWDIPIAAFWTGLLTYILTSGYDPAPITIMYVIGLIIGAIISYIIPHPIVLVFLGFVIALALQTWRDVQDFQDLCGYGSGILRLAIIITPCFAVVGLMHGFFISLLFPLSFGIGFYGGIILGVIFRVIYEVFKIACKWVHILRGWKIRSKWARAPR